MSSKIILFLVAAYSSLALAGDYGKGPSSQPFVLWNEVSKYSRLLAKPSGPGLLDVSNKVCEAVRGTAVETTGEVYTLNGELLWKEVTVLTGRCSGKTGWADISMLRDM